MWHASLERVLEATLRGMSLWDDVKTFFRREAADVKEGLDDLRDKLDAELTKREEELAASPSERLDMIKEDIESSGDIFGDIEDKIDQRMSDTEGRSEMLEMEQDDEDEGDSDSEETSE